MCQLILSDLKDATLNRVAIMALLIKDCDKNEDGYGIFCNGITTSMIKPILEEDLGKLIRSHVNKNTVLSHVRLASLAFKNNKKIEHNHPFDLQYLIGAHNGTLEIEKELETKYPGDIDSKIFFSELNEYIRNNIELPMENCITDVISRFKGKFAFLIFDKRNDQFYVIRGRTANLHQVKVYNGSKLLGIIVNTEKPELISALKSLKEFSALIGYNLNWGEIEELEKETIYVLRNGLLEKVGEAKETDKVYYTVINNGVEVVQNFLLKDSAERILKFIEEADLSIYELDELLDVWYNTPLLGLSTVLLHDFLDSVIPILNKEITSKKKHLWMEIYKITTAPYKSLELQFPWFLNTKEELGKALSISQMNRKQERVKC